MIVGLAIIFLLFFLGRKYKDNHLPSEGESIEEWKKNYEKELESLKTKLKNGNNNTN